MFSFTPAILGRLAVDMREVRKKSNRKGVLKASVIFFLRTHSGAVGYPVIITGILPPSRIHIVSEATIRGRNLLSKRTSQAHLFADV